MYFEKTFQFIGYIIFYRYIFVIIINLFILVIIPDEEINENNTHGSGSLAHGHSMDSIPSSFTNGSCSPNSKLKY